MKCPNCGVELNLTLTMETSETSTKTKAMGKTVTFKMKGKPYTLTDDAIVRVGKIFPPDTIRDYFVKLEDRNGEIQEYPIKQVVREALKAAYNTFPEDYFTSQRAKHILTKLNFAVNRKT